MTEYINMWKNYANFTDRTTVRGYWMAFLFYYLAYIILRVSANAFSVLGLLMGATEGSVGAAVIVVGAARLFMTLSRLYSLAVLVPILAIAVRRLRDAGRPWFHIFFFLIPIAGLIILIVFHCEKSAPENDVPVV